MTQHVRKSYRNHRKATWAVVLVLVGVIAAVVIPAASGAADKTFTIELSSPVCSGGSATVTVTNTAKTQTLGSIEVSFPEGSIAMTSRGVEGADATRDPIRIDNLSLPKGSSTSFTVTFNAGTFSGQVTAVGKQSNMFNDTQGGANLFESPAPQQLSTVTCGTIQGRVFHDRNADGDFVVGSSSTVDNGDLPKAWAVKVFAKNVGASSYPSTPFTSTTSSATDGAYSVSVPFGRDYKLCVEAAGAADSGKAWGLQSPTGNTLCGKISDTSESASAGHELPNLSTNQTDKDFVVVPITGVLFGAGDTSTVDGYTVTAGTNNPDGKLPQRFTHEVWFDQNGERANFRFAPVTPCTGSCTQKLYLFETLSADVKRPSDGQLELVYDDIAPFEEGDLHAMRYCLIDPRQSGGALATTGVLPAPTASDPQSTSCIVEGHQTVIADGKIHFQYGVYSTVDGYRGGH